MKKKVELRKNIRPSESAALSPVTESESIGLEINTGSISATVDLIEAFITVISVSR
jgi:hypothetical protein